MDPSFNDALDF